MKSFIDNLTEDGELNVDLEDEIIDSTLLTHDGEVRNPHIQDEGGDGDDEEQEAEAEEGEDAEEEGNDE
jgi:NAD(P) transhydrogenase subunit alpha